MFSKMGGKKNQACAPRQTIKHTMPAAPAFKTDQNRELVISTCLPSDFVDPLAPTNVL